MATSRRVRSGLPPGAAFPSPFSGLFLVSPGVNPRARVTALGSLHHRFRARISVLAPHTTAPVTDDRMGIFSPLIAGHAPRRGDSHTTRAGRQPNRGDPSTSPLLQLLEAQVPAFVVVVVLLGLFGSHGLGCRRARHLLLVSRPPVGRSGDAV